MSYIFCSLYRRKQEPIRLGLQGRLAALPNDEPFRVAVLGGESKRGHKEKRRFNEMNILFTSL